MGPGSLSSLSSTLRQMMGVMGNDPMEVPPDMFNLFDHPLSLYGGCWSDGKLMQPVDMDTTHGE